MKKILLLRQILPLWFFLLTTGLSYSQSKECDLFATITVAAAEKYAEENSDFLAKWIGEALEDELVNQSVRKSISGTCEAVISYSALYLELSIDGTKDVIEGLYDSIAALEEEDSEYVIHLYKDED